MNKENFNKMNLAQDTQEKLLLSEYMVFCQYADTFDFNNYFRLDELSECELFSIFDFLYHEDCFLMLQNLLNKYNDKLLYSENAGMNDVELRNDFDARLEKLINYQNTSTHKI